MAKCYFDSADYKGSMDAALDLALQCIYKAVSTLDITCVEIIVPTQANFSIIEYSLRNIGWTKMGKINLHNDNYPVNLILGTVNSNLHIDTSAVIYYGLDSDQIFKVEEGNSTKIQIAIKEYADISLWGKTYNVQCLSNHAKDLHRDALSIKCEKAIDEVNFACNMTHKFAFHTSDEKLVKTYIRALHKYEPSLVNPDAMFEYGKGKYGWPLALANQLKRWVEMVNKGNLKGGDRTTSTLLAHYQR